MRVLGIDPGLTVTGWGIVESMGGRLVHLAHGCIRSPASAPLPERLGGIFTRLSEEIERHNPEEMSVENIFVAKNAQSALKLGHARGVAIAAASARRLPVHEYGALEVKKSVVGYGRAEKRQVQEMVKILLGLAKIPAKDAADALAVATCHIHHLSTPRGRGR